MKRVSHPSRPAAWVFVTLLVSYAFFWHSRDWNSASRLMLTYSLVDRGTIRIDGLESQTGDRARFEGHSYTDKLPGYPLLAAPIYAVAKTLRGLPDHPLAVAGIPHWEADYWTTLGTSGLASALLGALLAWWAADLGCGPRQSLLVGLAYGLTTPAYAYATLAYGHQLSALSLVGAFRLIWAAPGSKSAARRLGFAGVCAATAATIELQVGPVAAVLGVYVLTLTLGCRLPPTALLAFGLGAALPTAILLGYDQIAFGSPWDMGYFHEVHSNFAKVHSRANPLGLGTPVWSRISPLLVARRRGLLVYAPILVLAIPGWFALMARRYWAVATVSIAACLSVFLVNLSYPEWTGGWSTGPRLLVPLLPFAMLAVAGLLAVGGSAASAPALVLAVCGGIALLLYQGVGARIPHGYPNPLLDPVWPLWRGDPLPAGWVNGERFSWTLISWWAPQQLQGWPETRRWVQFAPLVAFQVVAIALACRNLPASVGTPPRGS